MGSFSEIFDDLGSWQIFASGQAQAALNATEGPEKQSALRLEYDFMGGAGFIAIRRELLARLPGAFRISFFVRGAGLRNDLEFKVAAGPNIWRHQCRSLELSQQWMPVVIHERNLPFAWGPVGGGAPSDIDAVEFVIAAGPGGNGQLELSMPQLEDQTFTGPAATVASSSHSGSAPENVFTGNGWRASTDDPSPFWETDFGHIVRFGGVVIDWPEPFVPRNFELSTSEDHERWQYIHRAAPALGARSHIAAPAAHARFLRITFSDAASAAIRSLALRPDSFSSTPNEFIHQVAADYPRGWYPRYWLREQSYWTPIGSPQGGKRALLNEEGLLECDEAGFSLEPFVLEKGTLLSWADVEPQLAMEHLGIPLPSVVWRKEPFSLEILPWMECVDGTQMLRVRYRISNAQPGTILVLAVRPFQVTPPWQAFRNLGGRSPIKNISWEGEYLRVEDKCILCSKAPSQVGVATFDEGGVIAFLGRGVFPARKHTNDATALGSAVMGWLLEDSSFEVTLSYSSMGAKGDRSAVFGDRSAASMEWLRVLGALEWHVPTSAQPAFDCLRTAAGHILINRDGPAIQPGPRRYTRSWIRDCVIMGYGLCKVGVPGPLREFLQWYAGFQREDGFVPCVVDRDGIDWLVEHDSHGQFLWGIFQAMRHGADSAFLSALMPHVRRAAGFLIALRKTRLTEDHRQKAFFGLLPESASHEGYLAHPVHSYWDDFWGIRGLQAAAQLAAEAGSFEEGAHWHDEAARFEVDLLASMNRLIAERQLSYIPGSVEWADLDPTATANAIGLLDFARVLPAGPLGSMLDSYFQGVRQRVAGTSRAGNYSAYEIRIIGALARLGRRAEANELLNFFLSDRRPLAWNQWPEISWRDLRAPGHLGDVPHTWIAAEYIISLLSMIALEREADDSMVLAAGMPLEWIAADGFCVKGLPTRHGLLDLAISAGDSISLHLGGSLQLPPGGLFLQPPLPENKRMLEQPGVVTVDESGTVARIHKLPVELELKLFK